MRLWNLCVSYSITVVVLPDAFLKKRRNLEMKTIDGIGRNIVESVVV